MKTKKIENNKTLEAAILRLLTSREAKCIKGGMGTDPPPSGNITVQKVSFIN